MLPASVDAMARSGVVQAPPYTRAVRRWVVIVTLLAGFSRTDYVWSARVPRPTSIVRLLDQDRRAHGQPTTAWWVLT